VGRHRRPDRFSLDWSLTIRPVCPLPELGDGIPLIAVRRTFHPPAPKAIMKFPMCLRGLLLQCWADVISANSSRMSTVGLRRILSSSKRSADRDQLRFAAAGDRFPTIRGRVLDDVGAHRRCHPYLVNLAGMWRTIHYLRRCDYSLFCARNY